MKSAIRLILASTAIVLAAAVPARGSAFSFGSIAIIGFDITVANAGATVNPGETFTSQATASASNSNGDAASDFDESEEGAFAEADVVTASAAGGFDCCGLFADSFAYAESPLVNVSTAMGQGLLFDSFFVTCETDCASGSTTVTFELELEGYLFLGAAGGGYAFGEQIMNFLVDDETLLFHHVVMEIVNDELEDEWGPITLTATMDVAYDTLHSMLFRVDSESIAMDAEVPEPGTLTLLGLGLAGVAVRARRRRT